MPGTIPGIATTAMHDAGIHVGYFPGCIGAVVALHASYYSREAGFGLAFEAKVASELAEFMCRYDERCDLLLLSVVAGEVHASLAIDGKSATTEGAHLRWFIVSDALRGKGVGASLMAAAIEFVESRNFAKTYLWTFSELRAARHLYLKFGFRLAHESKGRQWGREVDEQMYVRDSAR
ncbi:MAG: GNAT family N-acetyltransferase [Burkholderiaceae bacterium]|nr:GNAT family N-acetyltransferase [Burkholderiaceae bacterium]